MLKDELTTTRKALGINLDDKIYGSFAEIGAGQEVARHFFQAGHASHTVAKTMSAYDKVFSDSIYGKAPRFVCQARLENMLDHEFHLLEERLGPVRGAKTQFFAFANTVATSSHKDTSGCHCWMGLRFQTRPGAPPTDLIIHVRMLDRMRLQQQEALGVLGVNLIFAAYYLMEMGNDFVSSLTENLGDDRIEVDYILLSGQEVDLKESRRLNLELVRQGLSSAVLFGTDGLPKPLADSLYGKSVLFQRGQYRPITNVNVEILKRSKEQLKKLNLCEQDDPVLLRELTMQKNGGKKSPEIQDYLERVDCIGAVGDYSLVTNYSLIAETRKLLRSCTSKELVAVIGASTLDSLLSKENYAHLPGGILQGFGELFDEQTVMLIYPYKSENICLTAQSYFPDPDVMPLFKYLLENKKLVDILDCDNVDTSLHSETVRGMMAEKQKDWEDLVPAPVRDLIKAKNLFGYKG